MFENTGHEHLHVGGGSYGEYLRNKYGSGVVENKEAPRQKTGRWWEDELSYVDDGYGYNYNEYSGKSLSSVGRWSSWSFGGGWGTGVNGALDRVAYSTARLLNTIHNSSGGGAEKSVNLVWASKQNDEDDSAQHRINMDNSPLHNRVVLNPDFVIKPDGTNDKSENPEIVDAVGGFGLIMTSMKATADTIDWVEHNAIVQHAKARTPGFTYIDPSVYEMCYRNLQIGIATVSITTQWPGFAGYIKRYHESLCTSAESFSTAVDRMISMNYMYHAAAYMLAWFCARANTDLTISDAAVSKLPPGASSLTSAVKELSASVMEKAFEDGKQRHDHVRQALKTIHDWYPLDPSNQPKDPSGGNIPGPTGGDMPIETNHKQVPPDYKIDGDTSEFDRPDLPSGVGFVDDVKVVRFFDK